MTKILLVEDDDALALGIEYSLQAENYEVVRAANVATATANLDKERRGEERFSLLLFDVMLPDGNGFDLMKKVQELGIDVPVIFLTAVSDEVNVIQGLDLGADDYITKPFYVRELMSRIRAVLRRYQKLDNNDILVYRDLSINTSKVEVYKRVNGESKQIRLTASEYKLLIYFIQNKGQVLTRSNILERLFDESGNFVDDNTLSVYMNRLREKISDKSDSAPYIRTVRGMGYILD